jgi:hypothetical protein
VRRPPFKVRQPSGLTGSVQRGEHGERVLDGRDVVRAQEGGALPGGENLGGQRRGPGPGRLPPGQRAQEGLTRG